MKKVFINADGGARNNPGAAAIGIIIFDEERNELQRYKECIGTTTNNVAEYKALIKSLQLAASFTREEVQVFMDSELIVNQVNGTYKIKAEHLLSLFQDVKDYERTFSKVIYNYVPRTNRFQSIADQLVNEALDGK